MKIADLQRDIEESLASLHSVNLPSELRGLTHLPVGDHNPEVTIRYVNSDRKVREDASASYFDPDACAVMIRFVRLEDQLNETAGSDAGDSLPEGPASEFDFETATDQLIDELQAAERMRPFVGLKWFRDSFLPERGRAWARDPRVSGAVLRRATEQRLVLTSQVPNPNQPLHPVMAIRVNRKHPRFRPEAPRRATGFRPVRIKGGPISDTVLDDRL